MNTKDNEGRIPLTQAVMLRREKSVELLLRRDDLQVSDPERRTALFWAVHSQDYPIIELLLQRNDMNVDRTNVDGLTPLRRALDRNDLNTVKLLLRSKKDFDLNAADDHGRMPLYESTCSLKQLEEEDYDGLRQLFLLYNKYK